MSNRKTFFSFRSFLFIIFSFLSVVSLTYAATTIGNNIFTSGTLTSQGKAYLTGGADISVLNATSSLIDNLTVDQNASLATTTISNILTTQAPVNFTNGMVSVKAPFKIEKVGDYATSNDIVDVFIKGHYAYLANMGGGLKIFDISDPVNPILVGGYPTIGGYVFSVYVSGKYAYIGFFNSTAWLLIINISDPIAPSLVGSYNFGTNERINGVYVKGKYAYVTASVFNSSTGTYIAHLYIANISNPADPILIGSYSAAVNTQRVYVSGHYAYVANGFNGLAIFDISDPTNPVLTGSYDTTGDVYDAYVSGKYAYLADGANGIDVIDVSNPAAPALVGNYKTADTAHGIYIAGHYAYLATEGSTGKLDIIDVSNPASPILVNSYNDFSGIPSLIGGDWYELFLPVVKGNYLYLIESNMGTIYNAHLYVLSLSGLSSPTANLGNIQSNNLTVTENTNLNQLNVNESLTVGKNALFNNDLTIQGNLNVLNNATINKALSATDISSDYATTSQYIALPTVKFIPTATPTNPKLGQCFMDNGAKPQVSCYDGTTWHTLW